MQSGGRRGNVDDVPIEVAPSCFALRPGQRCFDWVSRQSRHPRAKSPSNWFPDTYPTNVRVVRSPRMKSAVVITGRRRPPSAKIVCPVTYEASSEASLALKLCFERLLPPRRDQAAPFDMRPLKETSALNPRGFRWEFAQAKCFA
jgi:hypothetical protein